MKRTTLVILAAFCLGILAAPAVAAHNKDFKAIQNAVKKNPAYEEGREVQWFKVLITDAKSKAVKVKITLPLALVEAVLGCSKKGPLTIDLEDCDIDLKAIFAALKKAGPMALIELEDDGAIIKVWLE